MLNIDQVKFRYSCTDDGFDFSLNAARSEIVGVMGASGSGKSTLLELIAGFLIPESGSISWDGTDLAPIPPGKRPVTILFQNHNLFEHLSVTENIALGLTPRRKPDEGHTKVIYQALSDVGLSGMGERISSELSGGQQQRVALARAIVRPQPVVLLDEPFTGLDEDTKSENLKLVLELATKQNKCVLMVTHDVSDAKAIAHQLYKIEAGKLSKLR